MKVLFAGPSLFGAMPALGDIQLRPPAVQGDLARAVLDGATAVGLVDGAFGEVAAVWHKEILFALGEGVRVFGAASMGALRAAECQSFGTVPVGEIAAAYASGRLDDDAAVAVQHAPAAFGYEPLTEALVDARASIERLASLGLVSAAEALALRASAENLFFGDRTPNTIVAGASLASGRPAAVVAAYAANRVSVKRADALLLVDHLHRLDDARGPRPGWIAASTPTWSRQLEKLRRDASTGCAAAE